jgi:hypothetical protein
MEMNTGRKGEKEKQEGKKMMCCRSLTASVINDGVIDCY